MEMVLNVLVLKYWPFTRARTDPFFRVFFTLKTAYDFLPFKEPLVPQPFSVHSCPLWSSHTSLSLFLFTLSLSVSIAVSQSSSMPPVFLDIVLRQNCGLMVTWLCGEYCIVRQLPALPSAVLTMLSWMSEHYVLTRGATVSNNKSLFCSVKFDKLLDLVSLLGLWKLCTWACNIYKMFLCIYSYNVTIQWTY